MEASSFPHPPLVLVASAQEWSARSIESILSPNGFAVLKARSGRQALERARTAHPDVLILDAALADIGGIELCRMLRGSPYITGSTPILITSAEPATRQQRLEALKAGAWETLGFPMDAEELVLKLAGYVSAKLDADRAREEGLLDETTGLYNLRGLLERIRELGADASRHDRALACVVFAAVPEGTPAGEEVDEELPAAAHRLAEVFKSSGRASDTIARLSPTEYVVLAPGTDAAGALKLAKRLAAVIEGKPQPEQPLSLRAGYFGVANFREASIDPVDLLVGATMALRKSRESGRTGQARFFSFDPTSPSAS